jgi:predicted acylesterase/phospholipase RssA
MEKSLCISGGGAKAVTILGMMYELYIRKELEGIKIFAGCSAGAFIATLYICGINPLQQLKYFPEINDLNFDMNTFQTLIDKAGVKRIQKYTKKFRKAVENKIGIENPTLKEFAEATGTTLYISAVNETKAKMIYFNHIDYPDIYLFDAIHASAAFPGAFIPIKIKGSSFIDGGYYSALPIEPLVHTDTIAISLSKPIYDDHIFGLVLKMLKMHSYLVKKEAIKRHPKLVLYECNSNFTILDFKKTKSELLDEFSYGRQQCPEIIKK